MQTGRSVKQYRAIDLSLFALMTMVFETVIIRAATGWFPAEAWTVSLVPAITAIVMVRWGPWCAIHAVLGGVVTALVSGGTFRQMAVYGIGNLMALTVLPLEKRWGWKRLQGDFLMKMSFSILVVLAMQTGRILTALILGAELNGIWLFITADCITYLFTVVIIWVASRADGILEEQDHYLRRLQDEPDQ